MLDKKYIDFLTQTFSLNSEDEAIGVIMLLPRAVNARLVGGDYDSEARQEKDYAKAEAMRNLYRFRAGLAPTKSVKLSTLVTHISYSTLCSNGIQHVDALLHALKEGLPELPNQCRQDVTEAAHCLNVHKQYQLPPHENVRQFMYLVKMLGEEVAELCWDAGVISFDHAANIVLLGDEHADVTLDAAIKDVIRDKMQEVHYANAAYTADTP